MARFPAISGVVLILTAAMATRAGELPAPGDTPTKGAPGRIMTLDTAKESPGIYESYTDLEPGAWTRVRIEVDGVRARLYVNDAPQPCLIVNDLKLGETRGLVGLWIGVGTEACFSNLRITPR